MMTLFVTIVAGLLILVEQTPSPAPTAQHLFETGQYARLLERIDQEADAPPEALYLAVQAALRLEPPDREAARKACQRLEGEGDETRAWTFIARSAASVIDHAGDAALASAERAAAIAPSDVFAHYQLGLAHGEKRAWPAAAAAFEKTAAIGPTFAYAHYYAGMAHYQLKRFDRMSASFERFLKLAPQAPERPAVETLLKTMRGRQTLHI
jgi:tetratricopeptide (TPR) repeat protein